MARVISFSRFYPSGHPQAGKPTNFVEKLLAGFPVKSTQPPPFALNTAKIFKPKLHTIRKGSRWQDGQIFSPRVWSGLPRRSKQLIIAPDQPIIKVMSFEIRHGEKYIGGKIIDQDTLVRLAENDGLTMLDFGFWFPVDFVGQIICWGDVDY